MEESLLKVVAQAAGIGGIAVGTLLLVFRDIIGKQIFPTLDRQRSYQSSCSSFRPVSIPVVSIDKT